MLTTKWFAAQAHDDRRFSSFAARVLPVVLVLALLAVLLGAAVLAGPHLASLAQSLIHHFAAGGASPRVCGIIPGTCYIPLA